MIETLRNLRQIPVKVYRHTDDAAPVLEAASGSLKNLLKACLVTGYGSQEPLGWEMPFEEPHRAAFRSVSETSNRHYLYVSNEKRPTAAVFGAGTMNSLDDALTKFGEGVMPIAFGDRKTPWILIGHEKAFVLLMQGTHPTYYPVYGAILYFGDVPSLFSNDGGSTVLCWRPTGEGGFRYSNDFYALSNLFFPVGINDPSPKRGNAVSLFGGGDAWGVLFNEPANPEDSSQYFLSPVYIREGEKIRALWPGIFAPSFNNYQRGMGEHRFLTDYAYCSTSERDGPTYIYVNKRFWLGI